MAHNDEKREATAFDLEALQAQAAQHLADKIETAADTVRSADVNAVIRQASDFTRAHPALVIGGAALLGFAATRLLASRNTDTSTADHAPEETARGTDAST